MLLASSPASATQSTHPRPRAGFLFLVVPEFREHSARVRRAANLKFYEVLKHCLLYRVGPA